MTFKRAVSNTKHALRTGLAVLAIAQFAIGLPVAQAQSAASNDSKTTTPIKHVIVIIGENRSFDHVFATYIPKKGQSVDNLLSKGIVTLDPNLNAIPGPHFHKAQQLAAVDSAPDVFLMSPPKTEFPNNILPSPLTGGPAFNPLVPGSGQSYIPNECGANTQELQCSASLALAEQSENGLSSEYYPSLLVGGAG